MSRQHERGFTLLEAAIATALVSFVVLAVSAAALQAMHGSATLAAREALTDDALNVLADLRATTAYDPNALANLPGRSYVASVVRDGETLSVAVSIAQSGANAPLVASVTVTDPNGASATESQQLYLEAPAPGSVIDQPSPSATTLAP